MKIKESIGMLQPEEQQAFRADLEARKFGNPPGLLEWFDACVALNDRDGDWNEQDLSQRMNGAKPPQDHLRYLRQRTAALVKCIDQFLIYKVFEADEILQGVCLLRALRSRGWRHAYLQKHKKILKQLDAEPLRTFDHYATQLSIEEDYLLSPLSAGLHDHEQPLFQDSLDALDHAYALKKLSLACKALSQDRMRKTNHQLPLIEELIRWVSRLDAEENPLLQLYALLYAMIADRRDTAEDPYFDAKRHLLQHWEALRAKPSTELQDLFTYMINHCVRSVNEGMEAFKMELVELYDLLLPAGILETDGKLNTGNFRNAYMALALSENQAALHRLVDGYGDRVEGPSAKSVVKLCSGYNAYRSGAYEQARAAFASAIQHLPHHIDHRLHAEAISMLVRVAYDANDFDEARDQLWNLKRLMIRKRLPETIAKPFELFAVFTDKLLKAAKAKTSVLEKQCQELNKRIAQTPDKVFAKKWLEDAVRQLCKISASPGSQG